MLLSGYIFALASHQSDHIVSQPKHRLSPTPPASRPGRPIEIFKHLCLKTVARVSSFYLLPRYDLFEIVTKNYTETDMNLWNESYVQNIHLHWTQPLFIVIFKQCQSYSPTGPSIYHRPLLVHSELGGKPSTAPSSSASAAQDSSFILSLFSGRT